MNEAAILAARRNLKEISKDEISDALERIIAGPEKKNAVVSDEKKRLVAYHGKMLFQYSPPYADPVNKFQNGNKPVVPICRGRTCPCGCFDA